MSRKVNSHTSFSAAGSTPGMSMSDFARLLIVCFIFLIPAIGSTPLNAQSAINIEETSRIEGITIAGEQVQKLFDARLSFNGVTMYCDSALRFINRNEIRAFGNIEIDTGEEIIWSDTLYYYVNRELSNLRGRVIIHQDSTTLFGESVDYSFLSKVAAFNKGIRLEDENGVLTALEGTYFQRQDSAVFRRQVQLSDSAQYAEGDSLFINRERGFLQLYSNILISDSTNHALLTGAYLEADSTGRRYVRENAYLRRINQDTASVSADTTHIFAHEITLTESDSADYIDAYQDVKVWTKRFSSLSDTLLYDTISEKFRLIEKPRAWHDDIQLSGPFISVQLDSSSVRELKSYTGAFAVQQDSATGRLHQIKGDTLTAMFRNGDISEIVIQPNSTLLYHTTDAEGNPDGAVQYNSPYTRLVFSGGSLQTVKAGKNEGFFIQENEELKNRRLNGFIWNPELRPEKPMNNPVPRFGPVPDSRPFTLPRRYLEFLESSSESPSDS